MAAGVVAVLLLGLLTTQLVLLRAQLRHVRSQDEVARALYGGCGPSCGRCRARCRR